MKRNKTIAMLMALVMLLGLMSGCTSAESVVTKMAKTMADKTLTKASFSVPMSFALTAAEETAEIDLQMDGTLWMSVDPYAYYAEIKYEGDVVDQWISDQMQMYMTKEDDSFVMYFYTKLGDAWSRVDTGLTEADLQEQSVETPSLESINYDSESLVLAEETQTIGGSEAYVVSYTFSGQLVQDEFDAQGGFSGMMEQAMESDAMGDAAAVLEAVDLSALDELDFTVLQMPVTLYIDKSSYELKQVDMTLAGLQPLMEQMMDVILGIAAEISGEDMSETGVSFTIPDINLSLIDLSYEPVEVKTVPEEGVILGKQASFEPAQEDGSYVLQEYGDAVRIVPVAGQNVTSVNYCTLTLGTADGNAATAYTMLGSDYTEEDMTAYVASRSDALTQQGLHVQTIDSTAGDYTVQTLSVQGLKLFYAWKQVGNGWLMVEAYNFANSSEAQVLQPALDAVSAYTLP